MFLVADQLRWSIVSSLWTCEIKDSFPNWKRLSTKLAIKRTYSFFISFEVSPSCPNPPVMNIASFFKVWVPNAINWRCSNIRDVRVLFFEDSWDELSKHNFIVLEVIALWPSPGFDSLEDFIVAAPKHKTWIVSGPSHLLSYFSFNNFNEFEIAWIDTVAEHKIVKEHDALSWSQF